MSVIPVSELRIPLRHLNLAARAWGDPRDPPILALHGWLDNAASFDRLAPLLEGHYLIALDLAGHGRSEHRAAGNWYAYVDYLDEIAEVLAWFDWPQFDLLGHSLGATLASVYAALAPERIGRLLLIEGLGPLVASADKALDGARKALQARATFNPEKLRIFPSIDRAIAARQAAGPLSVEAVRSIVERGVRYVGEVAGACVWSSDPRLTLSSAQRFTEDQLASILGGIHAPTFLVLAEPETTYLPRSLMEARISRVADIKVVRLPGHHHLHLDDAEPVAAAIRAFLKRHSSNMLGDA